MRRTISLVAALLLLGQAALALAQTGDFTFFGPKQYDHPDPGTLRFVESVGVPADITGPFTLRIRNGDGRDGVRDTSVYLNGARIVGEDDFEDAPAIERTVQLQSQNQLVVVIGGRPRTHLTLGISGRLVPPVPTALAPDPLTVLAGTAANVVATLAPTPRFAGALAVSTADGAVATAPVSVAFAAGQAAVPIPVTGVARGGTTLSVSLNGTSLSSQINVVAPLVTSLAPNPQTLFAGAKATVVATLAPAPVAAGALSVATGDPGVAAVPLSVPFAAGQTQVSIDVTGVAHGSTTLSASLNGSSVTSRVDVIAPQITSITPNSVTLFAGITTNVLVATLSPTPIATGTVSLSTADPGVATAPPAVEFAAGQTQVTIPVTGVARGGTTLTASLNGSSATARVEVVAPVVGALSPDPLKVFRNAKAIVQATLTPMPAFPGEISVKTGDPGVATAPASVLFAIGQTLVDIEVTGVAAGTTSLTVTLNGSSTTSQVTVLAPPPQINSISPESAAVGAQLTLRGDGFDPAPAANRVSFTRADGSAVPAAVIAANTSQVTVRVPQGAVSGPITLNNAGGTTQSPAFTLAALDTRFTATRAGINAPLTRSGTPVTPFVLGAVPGDALTFQVLAQPTKGTAIVVDNKLVYRATTAVNDVDQFPYRAIAADGSTRSGTALVKAYNSGNLTRCTQASTQTITPNPDPTLPPTVTVVRTNVQNCAFYGEVTTRTSADGLPVTVQYIAVRPSTGAAPKAAVFLIGGGDFDLNFIGNAATGQASTIGSNFLVRTAQIFADAGYLAIAMNGPSDLPAPAVRTIIDADLYRVSVRHAVDILMVLREVNTDNLDVFLAGTSRGAISAVATNLIGTGIALSSAVTRPSGSARFIGDPRHPNLQPGFVQRPSHVLWNALDQCFVTRPEDSQALADALGAAFDFVSGGFINDDDPCGSQHYHGYMGIEPDAVRKVTAWLDGRVAALAGNKRPDAAFGLLLPTAPGVPLQIDLAALTGDADGDALSYTLSHVGSGRGGTVVQNGSILTYTPPAGATGGTDNFVYVVTDGRGGVNAAVIRISIGN